MIASPRRAPRDGNSFGYLSTPDEWEAWTVANRAASYARPVVWCEWENHEGRSLCSRAARRDGLCGGHAMLAAKIAAAGAR